MAIPSDNATIRSEFGEMRSLNSSHLSGCRYDPQQRELTIEFQDGDTYTYRGVEQGVYEGLLSAGSPGTYFHAQIRGRYPHSMG